MPAILAVAGAGWYRLFSRRRPVPRALLEQILDAVPACVLTCDANGRIGYRNRVARAWNVAPAGGNVRRAARMSHATGVDGTPVVGDRLPIMRAMHTGRPCSMEMITNAPRQPVRAVMTHAYPLRDAAGEVIGAVSTSYDITQLRAHQGELAAFAGIVAHDLKAPLAAATCHLELAGEIADAMRASGEGRQSGGVGRQSGGDGRQSGGVGRQPGGGSAIAVEGKDAERLCRHLERMGAGLDGMRRLIDDLLAYTTARNSDLRPSDIDLRALVDAVIGPRLLDLFADPGHPTPEVRVGQLPAVHADQRLLRMLIGNLVDNAIKYAEPGRPARVDITGTLVRPGWIRLDVADRGIGIPEGQHAAIFDGFVRAHADLGYPGTGMGLAICRSVAERHGGTIVARDNRGGGTRFQVTLPAAVDTVAPVSPPPIVRVGRAV